MGDELNAQRDIRGEALQADQTYRYDVAEKTFVVDSNGEVSANHIKLLRLLATRPLHVVHHVGGVAEVTATAAAVARRHAAID